jgi:hypothetical protein
MHVKKLLLSTFAALLLMLLPADAAETVSPLQTLRTFSPPIAVQNAEVLQDGRTVELEITDAAHRLLFVSMGAARLPGSLAEMFAGVPDQEITVRLSQITSNVAQLPPGGPDEQLLYRLLQRWKTASSPVGAVKNGKRTAPPPNIAAEQRRLTEKVIATLKARNR